MKIFCIFIKIRLICYVNYFSLFSEDIISYLTQQFVFINPLDSIESKQMAEALDKEIPKISFIQNDEDKFQNGWFELAETFDINLIKNKLVFGFFGEINYMSEFSNYIYYIY